MANESYAAAVKARKLALASQESAQNEQKSAQKALDFARDKYQGLAGGPFVAPPMLEYLRELPNAISACKVEDYKEVDQHGRPVLRYATLPSGLKWLTLRSSILFVRHCYDDLWDIFMEKYGEHVKQDSTSPNKVLLLGTTGIGKTAALNYFLMRALAENRKVLFESRELRYYFHDGTVEYERLSQGVLEDYRHDHSVLLFVDHQINQPPPVCGAFTVAPISPDPQIYKEWRKNSCWTLWVPITSDAEVRAMNKIAYQVNEEEFEDRLLMYGPIPRQLFEADRHATIEALDAKIKSFDLAACMLHNMFIDGQLPDNKVGVSWWIMNATTDDYVSLSKIDWNSDFIAHEVLKDHVKNNLRNLGNTIANLLRNPGLHAPCKEYEYWSCGAIAGGAELTTHIQNSTRAKTKYGTIQFQAHDFELASNLSVESLLKVKGRLTYSKNATEPLCDAAAVLGDELLLFQMTIGKTHSFKGPTFKTYCQNARDKKLKKVRFVFVVPFIGGFKVPEDHIKKVKACAVKGLEVSLEIAELRPRTLLPSPTTSPS